MKIAITSQNRREVTGHAGRCRKFWVYEIENGQTLGRELLELPKEQAFHESSAQQPHPLDHVDVLISGGMGAGMQRRLVMKGVTPVVTVETDPDAAVSAYLAGTLPPMQPGQGCHDHHGHGHHH